VSGDAKSVETRSSGRIPNLKTRGRINRHKLLKAATELLRERRENAFRFNDVFKAAGVSRGSAYRIYNGLDDLMQDVTCEWIAGFIISIRAAHENVHPATWQELVDTMIESSARGWVASAGTLIALPRYHCVVPESYQDSIRELMQVFAELFNKFFDVPYVPGWFSVLGIGMQLSDVVFANAMRREGVISEHSIVEAQRVSRTYLAMHLPETIPVRPH